MIVHEPLFEEREGLIEVSARFELSLPIPFMPESLWYRFPIRYRESLNGRLDAFAPTALLVAMFAGEDIEFKGRLSPRLAYHLQEYMEIFHSWDSKLYKKVGITYGQLEEPVQADGKKMVCSAFSGGVDSFYTLWAHLPQNQTIAQAQVSHGLFLHGFDLRLDDPSNFEAASDAYAGIFQDHGMELIHASTNAYQFSEFRINWTMFFGAPLIGAALLLGDRMQRFYIPSGMPSYLDLFPQGSHPLIDHLLSTESTEVVHHGASLGRYEKLEALVSWPATFNKIRVCSDKLKMHGVENCSACHKCYRTMAFLELLDALPNYRNFSGRMRPVDYLRWGALTHLNPEIETTIRDIALRKGRLSTAFWMQTAILLHYVRKTILRFVKWFFNKDQLYLLKRRIYQPESKQNI